MLRHLRTLVNDIIHGTSHCVEYVNENNVNTTLSVHGIRSRKLIAPLLHMIYRLTTEYKIVVDNREKLPQTASGMICAVNHRQADDIVIAANAVKESAYIVFGNPFLAFETSNGLGLWANGLILLNRDDPISRKSTYEKMKYVINHGGNIIIFPEGYWNLDDNGQADDCHGADGHKSDNWLIQDINIGILRVAGETGCPIVPTILHYDEVKQKRCYIHRGSPFYVNKDDDLFAKKDELVTIMQTTYFYLCEKYSSYRRSELEKTETLEQQWLFLKQKLIEACDIPKIGYKLDLADEKRIGKAKVVCPITTKEQAFSHLDEIKPSCDNAFLFNKQNHF